MSMLGRWPSLRSPWLGDGNTLLATGLSGDRALMPSPEVPLGGDAFPGGVDGGHALGCDLHRFGRQPAGDLPIGMVLSHEPAVVPLQLLVAHASVGLEDEVGIIRALDVPGGDALEILVREGEDR